MSAAPRVPPVPAVLRLVQTVALGRWRESGEALFREVAELLEADSGREVLVSGCGDGVTTEWLAGRGLIVTGVDASPTAIERAEAHARAAEEPLSVSYEQSALDDLPHEDAVFSAAVGEPLLSAADSPARAVAELSRVTKPMGPVVLLQVTWSADLSDEAREMLVERLGLRPHLLIEWKQMMRDAGLVDIQVQDWTDVGAVARGEEASLTWQQKMHIVGNAWRRWGWKGARGAVEREKTLLKELGRERALGFQLLKGIKWPHQREDG
jgi:SAM-dependent methyltransferase